MTAAHCVEDKSTVNVIVLGLNKISELSSGEKYTISESDIHVHPDYDKSSPYIYYDIALIKISKWLR